MPEAVFYPYAFADEALQLEVLGLELDGREVPLADVLNPEDLVIGLNGRRIDRQLSLKVRLSSMDDGLADTVPNGESPGRALQVLALLELQDTRVRQAVKAQRSGTAWVAELILPSQLLAGRIAIEPVAVRQKAREPAKGFAHRKGEVVANGRILIIDLENRPVPPGGALDGEWVDFGAPGSPPALQERKDLAWFVDLSNPDRPKLLLNEGFPELKRALLAPQKVGKAARLRDALTHSILQPVLLVLAVEALRDWPVGEENPGHKWAEHVLQTLSALSTGGSEERQLEEWHRAWNAGETNVVFSDLQTSIQRHLKVAAAATQLVRSVEEEAPGA